ncbi:MAG: ATP-binding protein, partial [Spirochaetales bacterium]|nr:ATP-binding protein [Spirochaetales bacterium]MCF7937384.1 ATP-binding protein [Spirochaetales bacterium]
MAEKPKATKKKSGSGKGSGKLKISNNWNAISIIALSQNNPLKALAEFVENSIDANATEITLVRGKDRGQYYLKIIDNGDGIDDFTYVATHIADSVKAKLKKEGAEGIQGEFGIGLLSFWTVGEELTITSTGSEGVTRRMHLVRNNPGYSLQQVNKLIGDRGTTLLIRPILAGVRRLTGEKIQHYLASELRERINRRGVLIKINDRRSRKELVVEPHKFSGRLLHHLPSVAGPFGEVYHEIYLNTPSHENRVGLYRNGTRVLPSLSSIDHFNQEPWNSGYLTGIVDVPFLQLTPGTRDGIVYDDAFESFAVSMDPLGQALQQIIEEQKRAEEETASRKILHRISKAIKEALSFLPEEEYGWLSIGVGGGSRGSDKEN